MEREQIVKALEICANYKGCSDCAKCPLHNDEYVQCEQNLLESLALALIKELTEENERLSAENAKYEAENHAQFDKWLKLEEATKRRHTELFKEAKIVVKEDTVREMQENLNELLHTIPTVYNSHFRKLVAQVAERMLNEQPQQ